MAPKYILHYFDLTALGEPIRYLLSYGNINWEDNRYSAAQWETIKSTMPYGQMPVLHIDDKIFAQSSAISRYLAKRVGLSGKDDEWYYDPIPESKAAKEVLLKEQVPFYLNKFQQIVKENKGFLVNGKLTWADIYFVAPLKYFKDLYGRDFLEGYPLLQELVKKVESTPAIAKYIAKRPVGDRWRDPDFKYTLKYHF
ncbi:Glutathione-S-transferase S-3-like [Frankliniella occidentalis]|nr:Glutathione-S-transferase S-3-like [Frankliniella occidentalis]